MVYEQHLFFMSLWCHYTDFRLFGTLHVKTTTSGDIFLLSHMTYNCSLVQFENKNYMVVSRIHDSNCVCVTTCAVEVSKGSAGEEATFSILTSSLAGSPAAGGALYMVGAGV